MRLYKILLKNKYRSGLVEEVGLIFRVVCQISGQDNASYKIHKSYRHFQFQKVCSSFCQMLFLLL